MPGALALPPYLIRQRLTSKHFIFGAKICSKCIPACSNPGAARINCKPLSRNHRRRGRALTRRARSVAGGRGGGGNRTMQRTVGKGGAARSVGAAVQQAVPELAFRPE